MVGRVEEDAQKDGLKAVEAKSICIKLSYCNI